MKKIEKPKMKLVKVNEFVLKSEHMEHPKGVSLTVPDESYSIKELLERFTSGLGADLVVGEHNYDPGASHDSDDIEKLAHMDLYEREEYSTRLGADMLEKQKLIKQQEEAERKRQQEEQEEMDQVKKDYRDRKRKKSDAAGKKAAEDRATNDGNQNEEA